MDDTSSPFFFYLSSLTVDPLLLRPINTFHNEPLHTDSALYPASSSSLAYASLIHAGTRPLYFAVPTHAGEGVQAPNLPWYMGARPMLRGDEMSAGLGMGSDGGGLTPEDLQPFLPSPVFHYAPPVPSHTLSAPSSMDTTTTPTDIPFPSYSQSSAAPNPYLALAQPNIGGCAPFHASSPTSTSTSSHADAFLAPSQANILSASSAPSALAPATSSVHGAEAGVVLPPSSLSQPPVGFRMLNTPVAGYSHPAAAGLGAGAGEHVWGTVPAPTITNTDTITSSLQCYFPGGLPTTPASARAVLPHPSPSSPGYDHDDSAGSFIVVNSSAAYAFGRRSPGCSGSSSAGTPDEDAEDEVDGMTGVKALGSSPVHVDITTTTTASASTPAPITSPASPCTPPYHTVSLTSSPAPSSPALSDGSVYIPSPVRKKRAAGGAMGGVGVAKRVRGKRSSGCSSSGSSGAGSMAVVVGGTGGKRMGAAGGDSRPKWLIASEAAARARDRAMADGKPGTRGRVVTGDFLWKVFIMLTHPKYRKWVKWDPTIRQARVDDTRAFAENVYRRHCSSGKWESFQRNLTNYNAWGFRREVVPGTGKKSQTIFLPTWERVKSRWETVGGSLETLARAELELPKEEIEGIYGSSAPPSRGLQVSVGQSDDEDDYFESEEETLANQRARKRRELDEGQLSVGLYGKLLSPIELVPRKMRVAGGSEGDYLSPRSSERSVSPTNPFAGRSSLPTLGTTYPITPVSASPRISRFAKRPPSPVGRANSQMDWYMV